MRSSSRRSQGNASARSKLSLQASWPATIGCAALLAIATVVAYFPSLNGGFIWDDDLLIINNPIVKASDGLYRMWCTNEPLDYWPMTYTTFWIEWRLWEMNSLGYHVTNVVLHISAALLLWMILRKLFVPGAFLAALLFAVHPVNVESVAWIAQRKNTLALVFFLLSIVCYLRQETEPKVNPPNAKGLRPPRPNAFSNGWYWLSLLAFTLAMLSKGSVAILPPALLLIVWWQRRRIGFTDVAKTTPFFIVAGILVAVNIWFQTHGTGEVIRSAGFAERLAGAGAAAWFYWAKAWLPINLMFIYPQWQIQIHNWWWWLPLLGAIVVGALLLWKRDTRWGAPWLFAVGFFVVALVPVLGFVDVYFMKYSFVADHYEYIALIAVVALAAAGWIAWYKQSLGIVRSTAGIVLIAAIGTLSVLTWQQCKMYADMITLYKTTIDQNPLCWMAYNNLGKEYSDRNQIAEASNYYQRALQLRPNYSEAHFNLGLALSKEGRQLEAIQEYRQALKNPASQTAAATTHNNIGIALVTLGKSEEAIEEYQQTVQLRPNFAEARFNLGTALLNVGRIQDAVAQLEKAVELKPDFADAHYNLGDVLLKTGHPQEAIPHYEQALQIKPDFAKAHNNLATVLFQIGRAPEAIQHYQQALQARPDYPEAHNNLGFALLNTGRPQEAIEHFQRAQQLNPNYAQAYANAMVAYLQLNRPDEALASAEKALELARSQGQTALVEQVEAWLKEHRSQQGKPKGKDVSP